MTCELVALQLLQTYPGLGRLWAVNVENWSRFIRDFVVHAKTFSKSQGISKKARYVIETIDPDLSDFHHKGRTVMRVRFANGKDWFYKPRSTTLELQWFALLRWLNRAGFETPFKVIRVICRKDHSWMQAVAPRQCESRTEVTMYYRRAGAMLYLLYLLRGVDVHAGNIIAAGADPVVIDCESLLHPTIRISKEATQAEEGSILRTGMLPMSRGSSQSQNTSALGRKVLGSHSVRLKDQQMQAADFVDSIIAGFCDMDAFIRPRAARFQRALGRFRSHSCRHIYRPTMSYGSIMNQSLSPALLRDGFDRSLFLLAFCRDGLVPKRIVRSDLVALERGDIPIAHGRVSRPLQLPTKRVINEMLTQIRQALANN
ncbi:MAG TPA: type 2 lanthipeptide synthetase LanM [Chthoniobacterales bacterium]|nr:type 2 lanthipeptide synthetase LanM [Chthoniobacterales bacterium]